MYAEDGYALTFNSILLPLDEFDLVQVRGMTLDDLHPVGDVFTTPTLTHQSYLQPGILKLAYILNLESQR